MSYNVTIHRTSPDLLRTVEQNISLQGDCIKVVFSQMEFLPWDNPDNLISEEDETIVRRIKVNALLVLFLIGGPVNVINMAVFHKQGLNDRVNVCLFALSLADLLYLMAAMLHHTENIITQFTTKERFGPVMRFLTNHNVLFLTGFSFVSPVLSSIIATERCLCVFNPLKFQSLLRTKTMAIIVIVVYVLVLGLVFVVVFRYRIGCVYDPVAGVTIMTAVEGGFYRAHKEFINHLDSFVFGLGLPGTVMVVVTTMTVLTIVKLRQVVTWRSESSGGSGGSISPREVALTKMLVGNSIFFMFCMSPIALSRFSWLFFPEINSGRRRQNFFLASLWMLELCNIINATFNFFIYYTMGSRFRETFWTLFGRTVNQSTK